MAFCDSHKFEIDELGIARHVRTGSSYADRVLDGVALDTTLFWDYECNSYYISSNEKEEIVGDRNIDDTIQETTKYRGKETNRGEGKFYRKRRVPKKKNKNYPTKPKQNWHKRLSKVAQELSIPSLFIQEIELESVWCEIEDRVRDAEDKEYIRQLCARELRRAKANPEPYREGDIHSHICRQ